METIYYNGDIITMEEGREAEAVYVKNGRIEALGSEEDILQYRSGATELVNLQGRTLMPAFIDAHSHISALAQTLSLVDLSTCISISAIIAKLQESLQNKEMDGESWLVGFGYDHNSLEERRHPDKRDLDRVSTEYPILISHVSGHMGIVNSPGLERLDITEHTADPAGGRYGRIPGSSVPNGYMEESAFIYKAASIMQPTTEEVTRDLQMAQEVYLQNGITTVQDGLVHRKELKALAYMAAHGLWKVDVVAYTDVTERKILERDRSKREMSDKEISDKEIDVEAYSRYDGQYHQHLKIGGYKLVLDGSPQGKTAWLTKPYEGEETYRGSQVHSDAYVEEIVKHALREGRQLLIHCNGDAAAEQLIQAFYKGEAEYENRIRPVMIHAQILRKEQIRQMKELGIIPSYFIAHTYYWGDIHLQNLGERALHISPAASTRKENLIFTFHQDTPVIAPNMFETIWCAVNRVTKGGVSIGKEEAIGVYDALKAVTINAAYQYFEENTKGSITEGKNADLIIVDKNPLKIEKESIREIRIMETIKDGRRVWSAK